MTNKGASNRFLICFRPVTADSAHRRTVYTGNPRSPGGERVLTCISVAGDDVMPKIFTAKKRRASSEAFHWSRSKKNVRRNLSQAIKSIVLETLPMKKVRNGKTRQDPNRTSLQLEGSVDSARNQNASGISDEKSEPEMCRKSPPDPIQKVKTTSVSSPLSSHAFSSSGCCFSPSASTVSSGKRYRNYNPATVLCLMLVSLSVLVIWGRLCAILWTSTWLCFMPRNVDEIQEMDENSRDPGKTKTRNRAQEERRHGKNQKCLNLSRRLA